MNRTVIIVNKLLTLFDNLDCELIYNNNYELIISVVLSAQTTDKAVNKITPNLFSKYPDFHTLKDASFIDVLEIIKQLGLAKTKANNIIKLASMVVNDFNSEIPNTLEKLILLPGVGRKTANVVLALAFGVPSFAVDTHVYRVSQRLKFIKEIDDVKDCEFKLKKSIPKELLNDANMGILLFGRYYCKSKNPSCLNCIVKEYCKNANSK